jgi:spore photoproduct lyase
VRFSPTVKIFLNLPQILGEVGRIASQLKKPTAFYLGKLQDGLALDPLTGYSREMIPFFAGHPLARLTILTKSADVENLLPLEHRGHTTLSWTVNPPEVAEAFEKNAPGVPDRIEAMRRCSEAGYPVRAVVMPMVPIADWESVYRRFVEELLSRVRLNRITLGSICSYPHALRLTELKLGRSNPISRNLDPSGLKCGDGRLRFSRSLREGMYREVVHSIRRIQPDLEIGLCLENEATFGALDLLTCSPESDPGIMRVQRPLGGARRTLDVTTTQATQPGADHP